MFLLLAFPIIIIMRFFWLDFGLMFIHRDIYTNRKCQNLPGGEISLCTTVSHLIINHWILVKWPSIPNFSTASGTWLSP
jgi:hypothetical protein